MKGARSGGAHTDPLPHATTPLLQNVSTSRPATHHRQTPHQRLPRRPRPLWQQHAAAHAALAAPTAPLPIPAAPFYSPPHKFKSVSNAVM